MANDYYKILGLEPNASEAEIRKTYRKLSMKYHPDKNNNTEATDIFHKVSNAYEVLSDKESRSKYDFERNFSNKSMNIEDILSSVFGGNTTSNSSFMQTMGATNPNIRIFTNQDNIFDNDNIEFMKTTGFIPTTGFMQQSGLNMFNKPTPIVKTLNIKINQSYDGCNLPLEIYRWVKNGPIKKNERETLYIKIPKGVDNNEIIIIRDKGNINNDLRGDVKVFIKIINDTNLERDGLDLIFKQTISLKEALCGVSFDLHHLNGKTYKINNDLGSIIKPGYKKHIPKMGFIRDDSCGSLIIEFNVNFPEKISNENIKKLRDIL